MLCCSPPAKKVAKSIPFPIFATTDGKRSLTSLLPPHPSTPAPGDIAMGRGLKTPHRPVCKIFVNQSVGASPMPGGT